MKTSVQANYPPKRKRGNASELLEHAKECSPAAAEEAFRLLEGRWKMVILYHLFSATAALRFSELERAIPAVTQKMLIQQLRDLERDGIVARTVHPQVPPKVEYALTPVGQALRPALHALLEWADFRRRRVLPRAARPVKAPGR